MPVINIGAQESSVSYQMDLEDTHEIRGDFPRDLLRSLQPSARSSLEQHALGMNPTCKRRQQVDEYEKRVPKINAKSKEIVK